MSLQLFNVLTRTKEAFKPIQDGKVSLYVCGPTVYDFSHLGHAKMYVSFDVIVKWLRYAGWRVKYVQNITDVGHILDSGEDRILKGARKEKVDPMELVERYMREYFTDMDALGVSRPDISPRASAHVPEQIAMITTLIEKGHAYHADDGSVYFSVESFKEYGKLSGRKVEEQESSGRIRVRDAKHHPQDFVLWVRAPEDHLLKWPSPWGVGYPGWHIECSAMSAKYLGTTFDIHGGGVDNIFPHNECEIAQSEAAHGSTFSNYWMLGGSLNVDGVKMSKSLGNFLTIKDALKQYPAEALRFFILSGLYRSPADYSDSALQAASKGYERLNSAVRRIGDALKDAGSAENDSRLIEKTDQVRMQFTSAMNDDFNAPLALSALFDYASEVNKAIADGYASKTALDQAMAVFTELGGDVLGVVAGTAAGASRDSGSAEREAKLVEMLIDMRLQARKEKDFAKSDAIRNKLTEMGIVLEDGPKGTSWRLA